MITYIRFRVAQSEIPRFLKFYKNGITNLNAKNTISDYELSQCQSEKENFILRICWKSGHKTSLSKEDKIQLQIFLDKVNGYKDDILEMRNYTVF
ncbi:hypothetical protein [uncultured Aquimarina sp.]|uniref:hypothetical protein n=1 Tax=uncultured Aquimarina sp. TaxID=575652 RepID=UPI0026393A2F|nr:hypothetical protein [uncultured Aquimarina sp.]